MSNNDLFLKLIIIGDANVGKTKIIERYVNNCFNPCSIATTGIDFFTKKIKISNLNVKLQIWDTAGQEQFMAITSSYIKNSNGIILVYDITNPNSFKNLSKWLQIIKANSTNPDYEILLLGNKYDLEKKKVKYLDGINFAVTNDILMFEEVSALEDSDKLKNNIIEFINILVEKMIKNNSQKLLSTNKSLLINNGYHKTQSKCC